MVAFLAAAPPASSQVIRVRTVEVETGRAIPGAIVVLLDSTGRRVVQGLTDHLGRISLSAPMPGMYRVKADRIGHPGVTSDPFNTSNTETLTLEMSGERYALPEIAVSGSSACGRSENAATAQLWEEIQKALSASEVTSSSETVPLLVRRFVRYRSLSGALRSDSTMDTFVTRLSPFVTEDPVSLLAKGFIQQSEGRYRFFGPDAALLLSDGFLDAHCYRLASDKSAPDLVGLGFEPVKGRKVPEIKGVLWVDRQSAELRTLSYEYVNVPSLVRADGLGGRMEFERLASGAWIIRDWYIRAPDRVDYQRRLSARQPVASEPDAVVGFIDMGGSARPVSDPSGSLAEGVARTSQTSVVLRDVIIRVLSSEGRPIEGAFVAVAELDTTLTTGASGRVQFGDVAENRLRIRLRAIGHAPTAAVVLLDGDRRMVDTTITLTAQAQRLAPVVVTESAPTPSGKMAGFERRRKEGFGYHLDEQQLSNPLLGTLDKQLRQFGRIRIISCGRRLLPAALSAGTPQNDRIGCGIELCFFTVYVDGALYFSPSAPSPDFNLADYPIHTLQGVEVYSTATMPVEYNATGSSCGLILLWTK